MCHLQHEDAASRKQDGFHIQTTYGCSIEVLLHQERAKYMQACLDLICGWVNDGSPRRKKCVLAKYGEWESIIGGIIDWLVPEARFLGDHLKETLAVDSERDDTITFLKHLMIAFPTCDMNPVGVSQVAERVFPESGKSTLRDFVPDGLIGKSGLSSFAKRLGRWLKRVATRRWGSIELIPVEDKHDGVWKYRIGENIKAKSKVPALWFEEIDAA